MWDSAYWVPLVKKQKETVKAELDYEEWWAPQVKCSNCGHITLDRGRFCAGCGLPMDGDAPTLYIDGKPYYYAWNDDEKVGAFWPCEEADDLTTALKGE